MYSFTSWTNIQIKNIYEACAVILNFFYSKASRKTGSTSVVSSVIFLEFYAFKWKTHPTYLKSEVNRSFFFFLSAEMLV